MNPDTQKLSLGTLRPVVLATVDTKQSVAEALSELMIKLGVKQAFGIPGGAMAGIWGALSNSDLEVFNCRHEGGAAFAATEASLATGKPTIVFTTAGPGITNALTGLLAARDEGAKVILVSAYSSAPHRGRGAIQETSAHTLPVSGLFTAGEIFHYATIVEHPAQLTQVQQRLATGVQKQGGFVAHISIPTAIQSARLESPLPAIGGQAFQPAPDTAAVKNAAALLSGATFNIWVGFGARHASAEIIALAELTGAPVMCSPRAKGIFPESHPQFIGVTGLGGHQSVFDTLKSQRPEYTLVLGSRLGEPTSFWNTDLVPSTALIHVDINAEVFGTAYPDVPVIGVQAELRAFLQMLLMDEAWDVNPYKQARQCFNPAPAKPAASFSGTTVMPERLMEVIQNVVVDGSDAIVLAECGNSFTWSTHLLRFDTPGRYRVSTGVGAMGHCVTGVIGTASSKESKAVVIAGDGSMLMNNEINTAVKYSIPAVWIVLNDARYNMCHQGMATLGMTGADALIPEVDFAALARSMGADGIQVRDARRLQEAIETAMSASGPFVVDVIIDPDRLAPSKGRNTGLAAQQSPSASGPARSFPNN